MRSFFLVTAIVSVMTDALGMNVGKNVTPFAESLFGVWELKFGAPTQAILGPISFDYMAFGEGKLNAGFSALRDPDTDDVWFTLLNGQMWHVTGNGTQYCFGDVTSRRLFEQSPFEVDAVTETSVNFCWRSGLYGMPTHPKGCARCDCARILLNLTDPDTLRFQFWMPPPIVHVDVTFNRTGPEPTFQQAIESTMDTPYKQCQIVDHYGPNIPGEPGLRTTTTAPSREQNLEAASGCGQALAQKAMKMRNDDLLSKSWVKEETGAHDEECYQLNGVNLHLDNQARLLQPWKVMNVSDVKVRFTTPSPPCSPCDVTYAVSAKIQEDEYIAVGFKGRSWERDFPIPPEVSRPCYFGMCVDAYDNFTSDRIALGYTANGGCFREMVSAHMTGTPSDVDYRILRNTSVERSGAYTTIRFTLSQHWLYPNASSPGSKDGPFRVMWAIGAVTATGGAVTGDACDANLGYHFNHRGVAPLKWLTSGSTPCATPPAPPSPPATCPGGSFAACIAFCPSDPPSDFKACMGECHRRCDEGPLPGPTPAPGPSPPAPVPTPTPSHKCDICVTGACAACQQCINVKIGPCAPCWAEQTNGSACLPDCVVAGCWNRTLIV